MSLELGDFLPDGFNSKHTNQEFNYPTLYNRTIKGEFENCRFYNIKFNSIEIQSKFTKCSFVNCEFIGCNFAESIILDCEWSNTIIYSNSTFLKSEIRGTKFTNSEFESVNIKSTILFNCELAESTFEKVEFLDQCKIHNCRFSKDKLIGCHFYDFSIDKTQDIVESDFIECSFGKGVIANSVFSSVLFENSKFIGITFTIVDFSKVDFKLSEFHDNIFTGVKLIKSNGFPFKKDSPSNNIIAGNCLFHGMDLKGVNFSYTDLKGSNFRDCEINFSNFSNCNLIDCSFIKCDISNVDFRYSMFNMGNKFTDVICHQTKFELYQLKKMVNYGGLTEGQLADLFLPEDGLLKLKENFTGFLQWIHLISIIAFLSPYIGYTIYLGIKTRFFTIGSESDPTILSKIWEYIYSGSAMNSQFDSISFSVFILLSIYNIARFVLLYKTKQLELRQNSLGYMVRFSLDSKIEILYGFIKMKYSRLLFFVQYGFFFNLFFVSVHSYLFLMKTVHV